MKFCSDTATQMLGFLDLESQVAFAKTDKKNRKYVKKLMACKIYKGQILYCSRYDTVYNCSVGFQYDSEGRRFYEVVKVCKKTAFIVEVTKSGDTFIQKGSRRIRARIQRDVMHNLMWPFDKSLLWTLMCPSRHVFFARDLEASCEL